MESEQNIMANGYITQIIGPVIDVRFAMEDLPNINDAVAIQFGDKVIYAEVMQQRGEGVVRCVSFSPTEGLTRGAEVTATGSPIRVPVGERITGRLFNAIGQP